MPKRSHRVYDGTKRVLDLCAALVLLAVLWPLMACIALAILIADGPPALFRQPRPGRGGRLFTLLKFRTMREPRGDEPRLATDSDRLTPLGRILRASSLDELPQLLNVLAGQMSFVGPRPLLPEYLERYTREQARRHEVRPGMTGWAQVNGRNSRSWDERFTLDVYYVDNRSLVMDARIIGRTIGTILSREGVSAESHATMPEFMGTARDDASDGDED